MKLRKWVTRTLTVLIDVSNFGRQRYRQVFLLLLQLNLIEAIPTLKALIMAKVGSVEIPQDIIDNIIAAAGTDKSVLEQCSLVSSSFLLPSRKQLFSRIVLGSDLDCRGIHQFLVQNSVIQSFVRTIVIRNNNRCKKGDGYPSYINNASLLALLRLPFCSLERFTIHDFRKWRSISSEVKDAFSNIIHSSSLKTLHLDGISNLPITFFIDVHLTTLVLYRVSPNDFGGEDSSLLTGAGSKAVAPMASSHTVIDRCVWCLSKHDVCGTRSFASSAYPSLIQSIGGSTMPKFLPFICGLRVFNINFDLGSANMDDFGVLSFLMGSLGMSLTSPATLEHIEFSIRFSDRHDTTPFNSHRLIENLRDADVWTHLDTITTHPAGSRIKRVDININYSFRSNDFRKELVRDENVVLKTVLDCLHSLRTKGILFVKIHFGENVASFGYK